LIDVLHQTLHPHYGRSIIECIWEELDIVMDRLMSGEPEPDGRDPGRAEGLAMALALFTNTYAPDLDAVRERAVERWESRQAAGA
jgi:hypothetical protein